MSMRVFPTSVVASGLLVALTGLLAADDHPETPRTGRIRVVLPRGHADRPFKIEVTSQPRYFTPHASGPKRVATLTRETGWRLEAPDLGRGFYTLRLDDASKEAGFWLDPRAFRVTAGAKVRVVVRPAASPPKTGDALQDAIESRSYGRVAELLDEFEPQDRSGWRQVVAGLGLTCNRKDLKRLYAAKEWLLDNWLEQGKKTVETARLVAITSHRWRPTAAELSARTSDLLTVDRTAARAGDIKKLLEAVRRQRHRRSKPADWKAAEAEAALLYRLGRFQECLTVCKQSRSAETLPPLSLATNLCRAAVCLEVLGRYADAEAAHDEAAFQWLHAGRRGKLIQRVEHQASSCDSVYRNRIAESFHQGGSTTSRRVTSVAPGVRMVYEHTHPRKILAVDFGGRPPLLAFTFDKPTTIVIRDVEAGRSWSHTGGGWVRSLAFSPDGRQLVVGRGGGVIDLLDTGEGSIVKSLPGRGKVNDVEFSQDGRLLASAHRSSRAALWDVERGRLIKELALGGPGWKVHFFPDGRLLAGDMLWDPAENTTHAVQAAKSGRWFAHSANLVVQHDEVRGLLIQRVDDGVVTRTIPFEPRLVGRFQPYREKRFALFLGFEGTLRLWDLETGGSCVLARGATVRDSRMAVSPDGRYVAAVGARTAEHASNVIVWRLPDPLLQDPARFIEQCSADDEAAVPRR